ncbi:MAG: MFS transporter [Terriglobia bacterium]
MATTEQPANVLSGVDARPTRMRHVVLGVLCSLSVVNYLDRVCISKSAPFIMTDLGLTKVEMGLVFSAFTLAYALFEVPGGWLGDMIGPRKVITRIVVWWSMFTTFTGVANHLWTMITVRFLFGAGEAGTYPNSSKIIARWMPRTERGSAQGLMWMCGRWGGAFAPGLVAYMLLHMHWRTTFWVFGVVGIVWATFFWIWFRDWPHEKKGVNAAEIELIRRGQPPPVPRPEVPWLRLMKSGNLWAICWMYFCMSYGWYFYITWLPTYLEARGVSMIQSGILGGLPLFFGGIGCVLGGLLTDYVVRRTGSLRNRRYIGAAGFFCGSLCMASSVLISDPTWAVVVISMASFFGDMTMGSAWAVCLDVGHELAGTVSGCMNTWGNLGGALANVVTGFLVQTFGNWNLPIVVSGSIFFFGAILWLLIDPTRSVIDDRRTHS